MHRLTEINLRLFFIEKIFFKLQFLLFNHVVALQKCLHRQRNHSKLRYFRKKLFWVDLENTSIDLIWPKINIYSKFTFQFGTIIIYSSSNIPIVTPWTKNRVENSKIKKKCCWFQIRGALFNLMSQFFCKIWVRYIFERYF